MKAQIYLTGSRLSIYEGDNFIDFFNMNESETLKQFLDRIWETLVKDFNVPISDVQLLYRSKD